MVCGQRPAAFTLPFLHRLRRASAARCAAQAVPNMAGAPRQRQQSAEYEQIGKL
jgi:hypothetical protein